jgi:hypothetical protein
MLIGTPNRMAISCTKTSVVSAPSPMVIRMISVSDEMPLHEFHDVFRTILRWNSDLGYIFRVTFGSWGLKATTPVCVGGRGAAPPKFWSNCRHVRSISRIYRWCALRSLRFIDLCGRDYRLRGLARGVGFGRALDQTSIHLKKRVSFSMNTILA